ncbi:hypothetical protein NLI96_g4186 [Meripilus lineatus]|uniref:Uncharacterized protein n=1 Tax=Meripilus lineatus TaxID=2056292 RepID=A0AAD5V7K9_9APHY|nr:hypothetical protein NLI96_g4186 [Physisporinus lineatus]
MTTIHQTSLTNNNLTRPHQHQLQHHGMSSNPSLPSSSSTPPSSSSSSASTSLATTTATTASSSLSSTTAVPSLASSVAKLLPSSTFSFTSPYHPIDTSAATTPSSSSSPCTPLLTASALTAKALRRVSLALPSSPRVFPAWSFRDDTSVGSNTQINSGSGIQGSVEDGERKALKLRRVAMDDNDLGRAMPMVLQQRSAVVSATATSAMARQGGNPSPPLPPPPTEKKQRKKWTMEETQMLVSGCNKWGVGNWKAILNDPDLKFDNRSPVDLKDRFRTYFPDAYKQHYPNAKTHLSSKVRSSLPDGSSIFEKTRSKKRRPFTEEEDRALKAGYDRHGTVWATIVKDPIFQEQNRRSTDLRDRFRNAFPDLYMAAGYKPRLSAKKKKLEEFGRVGDGATTTTSTSATTSSGNASTTTGTATSSAAATPGGEMSSPVMGGAGQLEKRAHPLRSATDDFTIGRSGLGPVRRKRRHTTTGLFRGGTKSVPESTTNSEDEDDACGGALSEGEREKDNSPTSFFASPAFSLDSGSIATPTTSTPAANTTTTTTASASPSGGGLSPSGSGSVSQTVASTPSQQPQDDLYDSTDHSEIEMDIQTLESLNDSLSIRDYMPSDSIADSSQSTAWSSLDTPVHSWAQPSSTTATSPASTSNNNNNNGNSASNGNVLSGSPTMESDCDYFIPPQSPILEQFLADASSVFADPVFVDPVTAVVALATLVESVD